MKWFEYVKSDLHRYTGKVTVWNFLREFLLNKSFNVQVWFRLVSIEGGVGYFAKVVSYFKQKRTGIILGLNTQIGYGLYIGHGGPLVINPGTTIGDNVNLSQYTSIGSNSQNFAKVGNNVYIGPNVSLVEGVTVGDYATVGAGSVVVKDVDKEATVAGNYAKTLNYNNPGRFIKNEWKCVDR